MTRSANAFATGDRVVYLGNYFGYGEAVRGDDRRIARLSPPGAGAAAWFRLRRDVSARGAGGNAAKAAAAAIRTQPGEVLAWMVERRHRADGARLWRRSAAGLCRDPRRPAHDHPLDEHVARRGQRARRAIRMLLSALRHAAFTEEGGRAVRPCRGRSGAAARRRRATRSGGRRRDILDLAAPFGGFRRVVRASIGSSAGLSNAHLRSRSTRGAGRGGRLLAACFAPDGSVVDRLEA